MLMHRDGEQPHPAHALKSDWLDSDLRSQSSLRSQISDFRSHSDLRSAPNSTITGGIEDARLQAWRCSQTRWKPTRCMADLQSPIIKGTSSSATAGKVPKKMRGLVICVAGSSGAGSQHERGWLIIANE